ncbi:uncharacterized protein Z519_10100 [Cladophialophora bantiana CBS 173.52]|uniref:Uncharacterized protein n=1 Tax=Cladophialophora bantiana (strain ATCC 10958 / CBS 173.52 / CDC B-1940 / NIH 8579) TaxID=1442370 RepID=A0A0D2FRM7_CLAB1|nr:uncharacterized protein Z519_10100 [Cladophialophora bantiana CBS 173.52]KIW89247.1 hypothetical protein Z519_10100 [Cladophialophora bantiana CBS 173.52]
MGKITKSDRDQVRNVLGAGGWTVYYGDELELWEQVLGALSTVLGGAGIVAWIEWQLTAQLAKFGQKLDDLAEDLLDQVINILEDCITNGKSGEWNIGGVGIKVGGATYHHWWKIPGLTGWNKLPNTYQPYIGFRIAGPLPTKTESPNVQTETIQGPIKLSKTLPTPAPKEDPFPNI